VTRFVLVLAVLLPSLGALAQIGAGAGSGEATDADADSGAPRDDRIAIYADFGWAGRLPLGRWAPLTVWINAGERLLAGSVVVEYRQDTTQRARIRAPFTTTPGHSTAVRMAVHLPLGVQGVSIAVRDQRGRDLGRVPYEANPGPLAARLPEMVGAETLLIGAVGRVSLASAYRELARANQAGLAWSGAEVATLRQGDLPRTWRAYDGLTALIVREGSEPLPRIERDTSDAPAPRSTQPFFDHRAIEAVRTWVESGGRLVIVTPDPGIEWRRWLPDGPAGDLIRLGPLTTVRPAEGGQPRPGRPIRLTGRAASDGWTLSVPLDAHGSSGLVAQGPVGFGWVVVVGMDPASLPLASAAEQVDWWRSTLRQALSIPIRTQEESLAYRRWYGDERPAARERLATDSVLEELMSGIEPIGVVAFSIIGLSMLALGVLVGPVDWFLLGRLRRRHFSWMTALLWVLASTSLAYVGPRLMRSSDTTLRRVTVCDRLITPASRVAWRRGVTGIFAGRSGTLRLEEPDHPAWWRGESLGGWRHYQAGPALGVIDLRQSPAGGEAGSPIDSAALGLWTFRAFMDEGPEDWPGTARVARNPEGGYHVEVIGLDPGEEVVSARLRTRSAWFNLALEAAPDAGDAVALRGAVAPEDARPDPGRRWQPQTATDRWGRYDPAPFTPGVALSLPGPAVRELAIAHRIAMGRHAGVYLELESQHTDLRANWQTRDRHTRIVRLLVPVTGQEDRGRR